MTSPMGPFIGPSHVRGAVIATLDKWAPTYVAEAVRQVDRDLPMFTEFINQPPPSPSTTGEAPRYVVACPGTLGVPQRKGNGSYIATWDVQIALWLWGRDWQETEDTLGYYAAALRQLMLQQPSLGKFAESTFWRGERYTEVSHTAARTWGLVTVMFGVVVDGIVSAFAGPRQPSVNPAIPPPPDPNVLSTQITVHTTP